MRTLGLAVQHPLATEAGGEAKAAHRQGEAILEGVQVRAAGEALGLAAAFRLDASQQRRIRRTDLVFSQAADALDIEDAAGDLDPVDGLAVSAPDPDLRGRTCVAVEADHEQPLSRRRAYLICVEPDLGARRGAADRKAALLEFAGKREPGRRGLGPAGERHGGAREDQGPAIQALALPRVSIHRWVASRGPA